MVELLRSFGLHRRSPTAVRHRCAQHCDSDGADSNITALRMTTLGHHSNVYISVTAMANDTTVTAVTTDSAVSVVAADTAVTVMFTLV